MLRPARTLLILLVVAVGGVSALGYLAYRYTRLIEGEVTSGEDAVRRVDAFIAVRRAMRREIDSWHDAGPRPETLILVRNRTLVLHGLDPEAYAETRRVYRSWRGGRARPGTPMAAALEGRREELGRVELGPYEPLDS
jgi:hypothetical protein